jgi:hypothetical protein
MNIQNRNGQAPADRVQNLINSSIDGEINVIEQHELDGLLENSENVRNLNKELRAVTRLLDELPELEPPEFLQSAIERQVRLPVQSDADKKRSLAGGWLNTNWLRTGFALAAAVVVTVGVYEMGSAPITTRDATSMAGTVAKGTSLDQQGILLDVFRLDTGKLNGLVELRNKNDLFTLDVQLSSVEPSEMVVNLARHGLEIEGVSGMQEPDAAVSVVDGSVHLTGIGEQHFTLSLKRTSAAEYDAPLELGFFTNNKLIQKAQLNISQD